MQEFNALKTLKDPSHGGTSRGSVELIRKSLLRFGQARAQPIFSQSVDEQAEHHDQAKRGDALWLFDEHGRGQKQWILQKAKAAFDTALLFIRGHEFLIREDGSLQNIRRDDEARFGSLCWLLALSVHQIGPLRISSHIFPPCG